LPLTLDDYLQLLKATGGMLGDAQSDGIPDQLAPMLRRLEIKVDLWPELVTRYHDWFGHLVGKSRRLLERAAGAGRRWYRGQPRCGEAFG
jgi:hypothetical protein